MRRWHKNNIEVLVNALKEQEYTAYLCDYMGKKKPIVIELDYLDEYFAKSFELYGGHSLQYILMRKGFFDTPIGINAVIRQIEKFETDDIVVTQYSDGGVIVITNRPFDFQRQGQSADWWQIESTRFPSH